MNSSNRAAHSGTGDVRAASGAPATIVASHKSRLAITCPLASMSGLGQEVDGLVRCVKHAVVAVLANGDTEVVAIALLAGHGCFLLDSPQALLPVLSALGTAWHAQGSSGKRPACADFCPLDVAPPLDADRVPVPKCHFDLIFRPGRGRGG